MTHQLHAQALSVTTNYIMKMEVHLFLMLLYMLEELLLKIQDFPACMLKEQPTRFVILQIVVKLAKLFAAGVPVVVGICK